MATTTGYIDYAEQTTPANPSASHQRLFIDSSDHKVKRVNSSGTVVGVEGSGSGIASGTSFPGSPATNDLYFRTDRGIVYYYDGTRWLCTCPHQMSLTGSGDNAQGTTSTLACLARASVWHTTYDLWLGTLYATTYVAATNDGSNFWVVTLGNPTAAQSDFATSLGTFSTSADTAANWTTHTLAVNAAMGTTHKELALGPNTGKTGAPGALYAFGFLDYRLIG